MLIRSKFDRSIVIFRSAVIRVTEMTFKLTFDNKFFALAIHHMSFDTLSAGSFIAKFQENRLSPIEFKEILADGAFEL
jgi:hypothetical protein